MKNILPRYKRPLESIGDPIINVEYWDKAQDAFDNKEYKKTIIEVINYINPELLKNIDTTQDINLTQMQGSAEINVTVTDDFFKLSVPFLKITDATNEVALYRKVAEINFNILTLSQIKLREDELWFEYEMPIALCQPNKVYDLLREVCVYADDYDDLFINNYKASFYKTPQTKPLTEADKDIVWSQIQEILEDFQNYSQFFIEKRWDNYVWDITVICLLKISNMPYVHGQLRSDLIENIGALFDGNVDFNVRKDTGVNFIKKLCKMTREEVMGNVYHAEQFISLRFRSSEQIISDKLEKSLEIVDSYEKKESFFALSYYLQFVLLKLIYDFNIEENYKNLIHDVLEEVAGLEPNQAAPKLLKVFRAMHEQTVHNKKQKKGFFARLFS